MKDIVVSTKDDSITCTIQADKDVQDQSKFALKAIAGLQILCIQEDRKNDPRFGEMLKVLNNCVKDIERIYIGDIDEQPDPFEDFTD